MGLGGLLSASKCTVFMLDPTGTAPIEPILDIVPGLSPFRITCDLVDSEGKTSTYDVTTHPVQFGSDITTHVRKRLKAINITATLGATWPIMPTAPIPVRQGPSIFVPPALIPNDVFVPNGIPAPPGVRLDLVRLQNLEFLADQLGLVQVVTPRIGMDKCWITSVSSNWTPELGEQTKVTLTFGESNIVSPIPKVPDTPALAPGNTAASGGGTSATTEVAGGATPSDVPGVAPSDGAPIADEVGAPLQ